MKRKLNLEEIKALYESGLSHSEIARRAEISRERIRQLINNMKLPTGREMLAMKRQARALEVATAKVEKLKLKEQAKIEKDINIQNKYQPVQELWEAGKSLKAIEAETGICKGSLSWIIGTLRQRFGLFKKRRKYVRKK